MKVYELEITGRHNRTVKGTLTELNAYFGVDCKSVKTLINKVQRKYEEREAACYNRTFIDLKTEKIEEAQNA